MININELRQSLGAVQPEEVAELLDRLEAAESECLEQARLNGMGASREAALMAKLEAAEKEAAHIKEVEFPRKVRAVAAGWETKCARIEQERDALQAKVEAMEKQEPVAVAKYTTGGVTVHLVGDVRPGDILYLAPGAQTQGERK